MIMDFPGATWLPATAYRKGRRRRIGAIILHSSDGSVEGDLATLTGPRVSAHYYVTRCGHLYQLVREADTAYHAGTVRKDSWSNAATIGIEQEHRDGLQDWPAAQVRAVAELVADIRRRRGELPVLSHAVVAAPRGRKQDPAGYPWALLSGLVRAAAPVPSAENPCSLAGMVGHETTADRP